MIVRENIALSSLTTLRIGGSARYVLECSSPQDVLEAALFIRTHKLPYMVLGEGSNVLADDGEYEGIVICMRGGTLVITGETVTADAGVAWDSLVDAVAAAHLWGLENLAGIPGTVGASPVQNIGAYGMEVSQTIAWVDTINLITAAPERLSTAESAFEYRDSIFKRRPELVITSVTFTVSKTAQPRIEYADLQRAAHEGIPLTSPTEIAAAVRTIRSKKFPDLIEVGTAGSFFKNPILTQEAFSKLQKQYPDIPTYPLQNAIKIPLAWILDNVLSLRGYRNGPVRLFEAQPLVLVTEEGATRSDVEQMVQVIEQKVCSATEIKIEREVRSMQKNYL